MMDFILAAMPSATSRHNCFGETLQGRDCRNPVKAEGDWCGRCRGHYQPDIDKIRHPQILDPDLAVQYAKSRHRDIRRALAYRSDLPPAVIVVLSADSDPDVRERIAYFQKHLPVSIVERLLADENLRVRIVATRRLLHKAAHWAPLAVVDHDFVVRQAAAETLLPSDMVRHLAFDPIVNVREALARSGNIDDGLAALLVEDSEIGVRHALAGNKNVGFDILECLAQREIHGDDPPHKRLINQICNIRTRNCVF